MMKGRQALHACRSGHTQRQLIGFTQRLVFERIDDFNQRCFYYRASR